MSHRKLKRIFHKIYSLSFRIRRNNFVSCLALDVGDGAVTRRKFRLAPLQIPHHSRLWISNWWWFSLTSIWEWNATHKPINYSKARRLLRIYCRRYSLANNVLFWRTILLPMHISAPHWTSSECALESRHRRRRVVPCSRAGLSSAPWWSDLMNYEWSTINILIYPVIPLVHGGGDYTAEGWKLFYRCSTSNLGD